MRIFLTVCAASKAGAESPEQFFIRADRARDDLTKRGDEATRKNVAINTFLRINGGSAHIEFDVKGSAKHLGTFANAVILGAHDGVAEKAQQTTLKGLSLQETLPMESRAIESVVEDD